MLVEKQGALGRGDWRTFLLAEQRWSFQRPRRWQSLGQGGRKWEQEVKSQSKSEEEHWQKVDTNETDYNQKVRKVQSLGEDFKKNELGFIADWVRK